MTEIPHAELRNSALTGELQRDVGTFKKIMYYPENKDVVFPIPLASSYFEIPLVSHSCMILSYCFSVLSFLNIKYLYFLCKRNKSLKLEIKLAFHY